MPLEKLKSLTWQALILLVVAMACVTYLIATGAVKVDSRLLFDAVIGIALGGAGYRAGQGVERKKNSPQ